MARQSALSPPPDDPDPALRWQVISRDTFDRDAEASVEIEGVGLVPGLAELWARFLAETVQTASTWSDGQVVEHPVRGFIELRLVGPGSSIVLEGSLAGAYRLKRWLYPVPSTSLHLEGAETRLLRALAEAHASAGSIAEATLAILDEAEGATDREAFEATLGSLRDRWRG